MSGVYSAVSLIDKATRPGGVRESTATLNSNNNPREWFDFTYEVLGLVSAMVVVALVLYLLSLDRGQPPVFQRIGLDLRRKKFDAWWGFWLFAAIGVPGLGVLLRRPVVGITAEIIPAPDLAYWWTGALLILAALETPC
ncbi:hypothetical protein [Aeromicrobium sp. UC242_57]|uniref:hypothetical protein n=1 Tax=Aeromicrobium sp. UC242_57 TaxID=3374624 RepID=UPI0037AE5F10